VVIYRAVMALIGILLVLVTLTVSRSSAEGATIARVQERNRSAFQRLIDDYRPSLSGTTAVSGSGKILQFAAYGGFDGAVPIAGATLRFELRSGVPNLGRGTVLVRVNQSTGEEVMLADGFTDDSSFTASGNGVTVDFTTSGQTPGGGSVNTVRRTMTLHPKN
jgi:type II secretory pathway pseudopilin PulG